MAEETRNAVQAEEMKAKVKAQTAQAIADDAQKDLAEALPALDAALASLRNLNKNDVTEVIKKIATVASVWTVSPGRQNLSKTRQMLRFLLEAVWGL